MWAFEVTPAKLDEIYWSHALSDIQDYARLRLSWFQAQAFQQHEVMRIILKQAFGGGGKGSDENVRTQTPSSKEEAQMMLGGLFKK